MATKQSTFFSHFDRIYCINLDRQKNRWDLAQEEFMKVGIENKIVRFTAFDVPIPHVGCALSQRYIIQQAKSESLKNVLILEDDIEIIPENIKYLPGGLPEEWSLLY